MEELYVAYQVNTEGIINIHCSVNVLQSVYID